MDAEDPNPPNETITNLKVRDLSELRTSLDLWYLTFVSLGRMDHVNYHMSRIAT